MSFFFCSSLDFGTFSMLRRKFVVDSCQKEMFGGSFVISFVFRRVRGDVLYEWCDVLSVG